MAKTVDFGTNPRKEKQETPNPDKWVYSQTHKGTLKRFTIDIPEALHTRIKTACARKGVKMRDEVMRILEKHFSANE